MLSLELRERADEAWEGSSLLSLALRESDTGASSLLSLALRESDAGWVSPLSLDERADCRADKWGVMSPPFRAEVGDDAPPVGIERVGRCTSCELDGLCAPLLGDILLDALRGAWLGPCGAGGPP